MKNAPIFDTHAHYDDPQFDPDREQLLCRLPDLAWWVWSAAAVICPPPCKIRR